ncbi:hypothetical protein [Endozoicomonas sp. ALB091]|uniref:hypothetical protein n=1 Tax=Endozoicomonas sp. ALB091 TaxID=3403073 RepID=UPI003BB5C0C8
MCGGGGGSVVKDQSVQREQARMAQELEDDYQLRFMPIERELLNYARDQGQIGQAATAAKATAGQVFDAGAGQAERSLAGFGASMTASQQAATARLNNLNRNGAQVMAANSAREATDTRLDNLGSQMMNLGRQAQGQGLSGFNSAAGLENQRNQAAMQVAAQNRAGTYSAIGSVAGIGASLMMMSDKNAKQNIKPRSDEQDMADARSFDNYEYDYKPGMSAGRSEKGHVGGMAQSMPESMSNGKAVDVGDVAMVAMGAIRNIDKRLKKMEQRRNG